MIWTRFFKIYYKFVYVRVYSLSEYLQNGVTQSYDVNDAEGKYFVRPPMTEWELQMEERGNKIMEDLPF